MCATESQFIKWRHNVGFYFGILNEQRVINYASYLDKNIWSINTCILWT